MADVFICHVEEDETVAMALADSLEAAGMTTWYYERDADPGPSYLLQTGTAIDACKAMMLIISSAAISHPNQMDSEIIQGFEQAKAFVPVLVDVTHEEFQQRQPTWRRVVGAATTVRIPGDGIHAIVPRLIRGLLVLGIPARGEEPPTPPPESNHEKAAALYRSVASMVVAHEWARARATLEEVLALDPAHVQARKDLESVLERSYVDMPRPEPRTPVQIELHPVRVRAKAMARYELRLTNPNTVTVGVSISPRSAQSSLLITLHPRSHEIDPMESVVSEVIVRPERPALLRRPPDRAFELDVAVDGAPASVVHGTLVQDRRVPLWSTALLLPILAFIIATWLADGASGYVDAVAADRPLHFCSFEDTQSPCGSTLESDAFGSVETEPGPFEGSAAAGFDGSTSWISLDEPLQITGDFTIEVWVQLEGDIGNKDHVLGVQDECGKNINFAQARFRLFTPPSPSVCGEQDPGEFDSVISGSEISSDSWTYWVLTRAGSVISLFRDGKPDTSEEDPGVPSRSDLVFDAIGRSGDGFLGGSLAYLAIYDEALSESDVEEHFAAAAG